MKKVIDVSYAQERIDWNAVKGNIDGAIIRCGYGDNVHSQDDVQWLRNVSECERLGIPYGVYLYSYAGREAQVRSEIDHTLRLIDGKNPVIGVYDDLEENSLGYMAKTAAEMWCDQINAKGYKAGIYCGAYYYRSYLMGTHERLKSRWWIAAYPPTWKDNGTLQPEYKPDPGFSYDGWQYSSHGRVPGIYTPVDMNEWYTDFDGDTPKPQPETVPHVTYELRGNRGNMASGRDGQMVKLPDPLTAIRIGVDVGRIEYRAHCAGVWLPKVSGNDWSDFENGYAGDDAHTIDALQIYYYTDTAKTPYYEAVYSVKPFGMEELRPVHDTDWQDYDGDSTAGIFWTTIEGVKISLDRC